MTSPSGHRDLGGRQLALRSGQQQGQRNERHDPIASDHPHRQPLAELRAEAPAVDARAPAANVDPESRAEDDQLEGGQQAPPPGVWVQRGARRPSAPGHRAARRPGFGKRVGNQTVIAHDARPLGQRQELVQRRGREQRRKGPRNSELEQRIHVSRPKRSTVAV